MTIPKTTTEERQRLSTPIEAIKAAVPIEIYAGSHTQLKECGKELRGPCPIHGGSNPTAFSVNTEKQKFRCFACGEYGDVIDLCEAVEKHADTWAAVVSLATAYGVALPEKPEKWRRWQDEKGRRREAILHVRTRLYQRRLLRMMFGEELDAIVDEEERRREAEAIYKDLYPLAYKCAKQREAL